MSINQLRAIQKGKSAASSTDATPYTAEYVPTGGMKESDIVSVPDFPLEVLPEKHKAIVEDLATYLSYPKDFSATGMIAAASIAAGRTHEFNNGMWSDGGCLYMAIVAPPGTKKSHPLEFALDPCIQANKRAIKKYQRDKNMLMADGSASDPKEDSQFIFSDFTIETLTKAIRKHPRGISVYIDELKAWIQNFNRYNAGSEQEFWLMNWSGKPYALNRASYKAVLDKTYIPVVGTIQPGLLEDIGKGGRALSGFIERILFCFPDDVPIVPFKRRRDRQFDIYHQLQMRYSPLVTTILDYQRYEVPEYSDEEGMSILCICDEAAEDRLTDHLNNMQDRMKDIDNEYVRNVYSKMQSYLCRFTLLLHLMHEAAGEITSRNSNPNGEVRIGMAIVLKAIKLTEYFLLHGLKAQSQINSATPLDRLPLNIRKWYSALPSGKVLTTQEIEAVTIKHGLSRATMFIYLGEVDPRKKLFIRERHGLYEKLYHR